MKIPYLFFRQIFFTKRNRPAQKIIVDIMPVNQIIIISDNSKPAQDLCLKSKFLLQFALQGFLKIFALLNAAARSLYKSPVPKIIVPLNLNKIKIRRFIKNYRAHNFPVLIRIFKRPFLILQIQIHFFKIIHEDILSSELLLLQRDSFPAFSYIIHHKKYVKSFIITNYKNTKCKFLLTISNSMIKLLYCYQ